MAFKLTAAIRNAGLNAIRDALDADENPGYIEFYDGDQPAQGGGAVGGSTLLATCTLSKPCAGGADGGELTFNAITDDEDAADDGDASWCRFKDGAGTWVADGDVGVTDSGAVIELNSVSISKGGIVRVTSGKITAGNAA